MPDITMCCNKLCRMTKTCYRYRAVPDQHWQAYSSFDKDTDRIPCQNYVAIAPNEDLMPYDD